MERLSRKIGRHLNYATVVSALTVFVVLAGGAALAAEQLAKNSVGKKQLKANAVTTAKIKKNAVTKAKIKAGAVAGEKFKPGSLGAPDFQLAGAPYTRIAHELRTSVNIAAPPMGTEPPIVAVPLPGLSYTQEAGRTDTYVGAADVTFQSTCTGERSAIAYLLMDPPPELKLNPPDLTLLFYIVAAGVVEDATPGQVTKRINLSSYTTFGSRFGPDTPQNHAFTLIFGGGCKAGEGITANQVALDVIGTN